MMSSCINKTRLKPERIAALFFTVLALWAPVAPALADAVTLPGITISVDDSGDGEKVATAFQVLALLTVLSLAPAILIALTSFTRIAIVLSMLRHATGLQSVPPNTVIISLALFLTLFTMMPVFEKINERALEPYSAGEVNFKQASKLAMEPLRDFMVSQTREKDLALMLDISGQALPGSVEEVKYTSLIPAFMISELQTAFQIGFVIFLPFLLIDILVASVLMSMGMIMLPPLSISLPIKILMFVLIEGWALVAQALVGSFY